MGYVGVASIVFFTLFISVASTLKEPKTSPSDRHRRRHSPVHLPLHHLDDRPPSASSLLRTDDLHVRAVFARLTNTSTGGGTLSSSADASIPLAPGDHIGVANYVTRIGLGTPATELTVLVDTGSSVSWVQCKPCGPFCYAQQDPVYDPKLSATYANVRCSTAECNAIPAATLNPSGCSLGKTCTYQATYGDGSFSTGSLATDTLSLPSSPPAALRRFVFGCGHRSRGLFGRTAGILGLSKNTLSLTSQLQSNSTSFSYCLPSTGSAGFLTLGGFSASGLSFTPMLDNLIAPSLYFIGLRTILVGGTPLADIMPAPYSVIDSGTVITRLPAIMYAALLEAVAVKTTGSKRAAAYSILDLCYEGSHVGLSVPELTLEFDGGAEMRLEKGSIFYDVAEKGVTCLAFARSDRTVIVGNWQQKTFRVAYDVGGQRVGFAAGGCS